ncbi:MAG: hypothetical protein KGS48_13790 [Bacteroidetes bacterium]|nr:hypothetical protein [Bacteroidota bacterium]
MKQKRLPKSFFLLLATVSISSFVFVNMHADIQFQANAKLSQVAEQKMEKETDDEKNYDLQIPNAGVLGRVLDVAQKLLDVAR